MPRTSFGQEVRDFVEAFKGGNELAYKWQWLKYLKQQQELNQKLHKQQLDLQEIFKKGSSGSGFTAPGPGSDNQTQPNTQQQATTPPKTAPTTQTPDAKTVKPQQSADEGDGSTPKEAGGSSGSTGKQASILDRYPGSYQEASLTSDLPPVRPALGGVPAPQGGATPALAKFDASKAPAYLDGIAQKYGINPTDFKRMAWIESKFDPNARASSSSAGGLFQFTNETARDYQLKNKFDGPANADAAARLWNDNKAGLTKALGREPTAGELYLAHQQGLGGAKALLSNPNARATDLLGHDAVVNNGGKSGMSARDFSNIWTGRFDNIGNEEGTTPRSAGAKTPSTPSTPTDARNTRQRTAADMSSMSDASDDIRRTGGMTQSAIPDGSTPKGGGAQDMSDKFNTKLTSGEELQFQQWARENPRLGSTYDYDARGFWKSGANAASNGHGADTWKKPNHPTFSDQSMYSGKDGFVGGKWDKGSNGSWSFEPSKTNLEFHPAEQLQQYFQQNERGNTLKMPQATNASAPASGGAQYSSGGNSYAESLKNAAPASAPQSAIPLEATGKMPSVQLPEGLHYQQYGDGPNSKFLLIDDKTKAPVSNLAGWEHASDAAKTVNASTTPPASAVPTEPPKTGTPEFPNSKSEPPPSADSMRRPDDLGGQSAPEGQSAGATQGGDTGGWGLDDLNISADFDIGGMMDGIGDSIGEAFGGIGDALGGIGDAIGGALSAFGNGGMVRGYWEGGPVEGDEDGPSMDAMPSALPVGGAQDESAGGDDDMFAGAAEAVKAGLQGLQEMFGLGGAAALPGANGVNQEGAKALLSGQGALSQQEMQAIKSTVDPNNQLGEGLANLAGLDAVYKTLLLHGETGKARQIAAGMIQFAHNRSTMLGNIALAALEKGDTTPAAQALVQAFNVIPNAQRVSVVDGHAVVQDMKSGKVIREIKLTPEVMLSAARRLAGGSDSYNELMSFASGKVGQQMADPAYDKYVQSQVDQEANNRPPALETTPAAASGATPASATSAPGGSEGAPQQALNIDPARDKNSPYYVEPPQLPAEPKKPFVSDMHPDNQKTVNADWWKAHQVWNQNVTKLTQQYNSAVTAANAKAKQDASAEQKKSSEATKKTEADRREAVKGVNDAWNEREEASKTPIPPKVAAAVKSTARVIMKDNDLDQYDGLEYADQLVNPNSKIELKEKKGGGGSVTMEDGTTLDLSPKAYGHVKHLREKGEPKAAVEDNRPSWTNEIKEGAKGGLRSIAADTIRNLSGRPVSSLNSKEDGQPIGWRGLDSVTTSSGYDKRFGPQ